MALQFSSDWANAFLWQGLHGQLGNRTYAYDTVNGRSAVTVFQGTQPTAPQVIASWTTYNVNFLIHWTPIVAPAPIGYTTLGGENRTTFTTPAAVAAFRSGTASWAIYWPNAYSQANIESATLPSNRFIIVPVSINSGAGCVKLTTLGLTAGTSYQPTDISLKFGVA
jgi:hypothetical protein